MPLFLIVYTNVFVVFLLHHLLNRSIFKRERLDSFMTHFTNAEVLFQSSC